MSDVDEGSAEAVKIQNFFRREQAKKALRARKQSPGVAARQWEDVKKNEGLKDKIIELDRVRAVYVEQAKKIVKEKADVVLMRAKEKKELVRDNIEKFAEKKISDGVKRAEESVASAVVDPFMPIRLQKWIRTSISALWPDVEEEIVNTVMSIVRDTPVLAPEPPPNKILGKLRYFLFPHDKSTWCQLRSPLFLFYKLICLTPVYGVPQIVYLFHLLVIDRSDEYQLITYILGFKALLFVTLGVVGMAVAAVQYYICFQEISGQDEAPICSVTAPREAIFVLGLFAVQVVLVWIAFWHLKYAERKGGELYHRALTEGTDEAHKTARERERATRSRLQTWLVYDVVCFIICLLLVVLCAFVGPNTRHGRVTREGWTHWRFEAALYMVKCLYGLLSLPFLFLKLPVVSTLMTHSKPTGYTAEGQCVPFVGNPDTEELQAVSDASAPDNGLWARPAPHPR